MQQIRGSCKMIVFAANRGALIQVSVAVLSLGRDAGQFEHSQLKLPQAALHQPARFAPGASEQLQVVTQQAEVNLCKVSRVMHGYEPGTLRLSNHIDPEHLL